MSYKYKGFKQYSALSTIATSVMLSGSILASELEVGDTSFKLYGFAKLDMLHDTGDLASSSKGLGNSIVFNNIGVDGDTVSDGATNFHVYESRLGVSSTTPTSKGDLTTVIEGDFYGGGGGEFRLRHAYGSWNGITAGQTWTNFNTFVGSTPVLDFTGLIGRAGINRQALIQYSSNGFSVALEAPNGAASGSSFDGGDGEEPVHILDADRKDRFPDLTLKYESGNDNLNYSLGGIIRDLSFNNGEEKDSATGWGLFLASNYTFNNGVVIRGQVTGGDGIGTYMTGTPAPAAYRVGDSLKTISSWGGTVGISYPVGPGDINVAYSYVESDWDDAISDGLDLASRDVERELAYVNYIWQPQKNITYGLEMAYASRETVADSTGSALRLRGSIIYSF